MGEVMESLQAHPLRLSRRRLAAGLVGTGGDGQVVKGGPAARHKSTKAADLFWKHVHPNVPLDCIFCLNNEGSRLFIHSDGLSTREPMFLMISPFL